MSKHLQSVSKVLRKVKALLTSTLALCMRVAVRMAAVVVLALTLLFVAAKAPEIHGGWIRAKVGAKTYKISGGPRTGGGTGFAVKGKSGISYIVTNDHVCDVTPDKFHVLVSDDHGKYMWRRILERSDKSDLCILEGLPGVEGLELGSEPHIGQILAAVGHPSGLPITLSRGEVITQDDIKIFKGVIIDPNDPADEEVKPFVNPAVAITPEQCSAPKNEIVKEKVDLFFVSFTAKLCLDVTRGAYRTNMLVQPGNSGSPVVDFWGNVVGVVFAMDRYTWGIAVSHHDLKQLLSNY